jgi:hypothetical protein
MLKFILISFVVWFVIFRLFRFKFVLYKNTHSSTSTNQRQGSNKPEGTITVDNLDSGKGRIRKDSQDGEYVDYEEV